MELIHILSALEASIGKALNPPLNLEYKKLCQIWLTADILQNQQGLPLSHGREASPYSFAAKGK
jgi:hypothetical protein